MRRVVTLVAFALCILPTLAAAQDVQPFLYQEIEETWCIIPQGEQPIPNEDSLSVQVDVYLLAGNQFVATYEEVRSLGAHPLGGTAIETVTEQFVQGSYSVSGSVINLPGLGSATMVGGTLEVLVTAPFANPNLSGQPIVLTVRGTSVSLLVLRNVMNANGITPMF